MGLIKEGFGCGRLGSVVRCRDWVLKRNEVFQNTVSSWASRANLTLYNR